MTEKKKRGFASLPREKLLEICRQGGKACHALGRGHRWTREQAMVAAAKGVEVRARRAAEAAKRAAEEAERRQPWLPRVPKSAP